MILLKKVSENILKNWFTIVPTVIVIALILTLFQGILAAYDQVQTVLTGVQQKFSITVYLKDSADPFEVGNIVTALEQQNDTVKEVTYTSKEQAWKIMSETFALDKELLQKYKFSLPASLTITPQAPEHAAKIESFLNQNAAHLLKESLSSKEKQKNITDKMTEFVENLRASAIKTLVMFVFLFLVGGTLLLSSTIYLSIASRRNEINIMKLVGAPRFAIIMPFMIEGIIVSIVSFLLYLFLFSLTASSSAFFMSKLNLNAFVLEFLAIIFMGAAVSYLTTLFYIKKKHIL